jgi:hypothetical protein
VGLSVLGSSAAWEMCLLRGYDAGGAEVLPGLLELYRIRELLLMVLADKDLNSIPILLVSEGWWCLA